MINHLAKLKRTTRFAHWRLLPSQALQNVIERIDFGYQKFFARDNKRPPTFRSRFRYQSYTLKQAGYKFLERNKVRIGKRIFRYHKSRKFDVERIKTVTIKRDRVGDLWLCVVAKAEGIKSFMIKNGKTAGFDFGLQTYLTASDSTRTQSPLFFNRNSRKVKKANRNLSRKKKGSNNRHRARVNHARVHRRVANQRRDYHWRLAHQLKTMTLCSLRNIQRCGAERLAIWDFLSILKYRGKKVAKLSNKLTTSKTCFFGTVKEDLELRERTFHCCACGLEMDRSLNHEVST